MTTQVRVENADFTGCLIFELWESKANGGPVLMEQHLLERGTDMIAGRVYTTDAAVRYVVLREPTSEEIAQIQARRLEMRR